MDTFLFGEQTKNKWEIETLGKRPGLGFRYYEARDFMGKIDRWGVSAQSMYINFLQHADAQWLFHRRNL